ncbi:MAG: hypothetical protein ACOH2N_13355 [Devosia sp.]
MDLTRNFERRPIPDAPGTIERTDEGVIIIHSTAGALPPVDDVHKALTRFHEVDRAAQTYATARERWEALYGRHERAMLLGVTGVPPKLLDNARVAMERASSDIESLKSGVYLNG